MMKNIVQNDEKYRRMNESSYLTRDRLILHDPNSVIEFHRNYLPIPQTKGIVARVHALPD